jgi:glycosyltransferase involved in cell wall biosynthesis
MAMAKAIIASSIGGAPEQVVDGKNGFIYTVGDVDDLTLKLNLMMDKQLLDKMGKQSRELVHEKFTLQKMVKLYEEAL